MIELNRIRTNQAIKAKFKGPGKNKKDKELMFAKREYLKDSMNIISFDSTYWKTAKSQLKKESGGKCAYCEANAEVVAHGDVEHYRPKSIYWWLAYTYDNYLYACQICNQIYKSDNFPIQGVKLSEPDIKATTTDDEIEELVGNISPDPIDINQNCTLQYFTSVHVAERALLINPYFDNPATYFAYEADDLTKEVKIISSDPGYISHFEAAEEFYGINRIELRNFRYQVFRQFRVYKLTLKENITNELRAEVESQIELMKSYEYIFAGMCRYFDKIL
jgi:uncharacterized protein (TIGR02646 family)